MVGKKVKIMGLACSIMASSAISVAGASAAEAERPDESLGGRVQYEAVEGEGDGDGQDEYEKLLRGQDKKSGLSKHKTFKVANAAGHHRMQSSSLSGSISPNIVRQYAPSRATLDVLKSNSPNDGIPADEPRTSNEVSVALVERATIAKNWRRMKVREPW